MRVLKLNYIHNKDIQCTQVPQMSFTEMIYLENQDYDKAANMAASLWFDNAHIKLIHYSENHTYKVTSNNTTSILRISRVKYHTLNQIKSELKWIDALSCKTNLLVAKPIGSRSGNMAETVELDSGQKFICCMFEYIAGITPEFSDLKDSIPLFNELGYKTAILHNFCKSWGEAAALDRPKWDCESTIGDKAKWGSWKYFEGFIKPEIELLDEAKNTIEHHISDYGCNKDNFGLIHSDIRFANLIQTDTDVFIIDFDDSAFSWYMYDIACSLSFIEDDANISELACAWLEGYAKQSSLDCKDIKMIATFIMMRRLQLTGWLASHSDSDPVPGFKEGWIEGTLKVAKLYLEDSLLDLH